MRIHPTSCIVGFALTIPALFLAVPAVAEQAPAPRSLLQDFSIDVGVHWFKLAADRPAELQPGAVFDRWEGINASPDYAVHDYTALKPLYFNMVFGVDALIRYRRYLMVKLGYEFTHPFGIGGYGHINYLDRITGAEIQESNDFSFTSHQLTTFLGPIVSVDEDRVDIYLAFSPMAPTWVRYRERYERIQNGVVVASTNEHYRGFFGNCRALVGMQVRVTPHFKLGSEAVFAFLNYMQLESSTRSDTSFRFPFMQWHFTARYAF